MKKFYENIGLNKITLSFPKEIEIEYQKYFLLDSINVFRFAFLMVISLYGLFGILDSYVVEDNINFFYAIRFGIVIPTLLIVYCLSYTKYFAKIWQWLLFFSMILGGLGIIAMLSKIPEEYSYYQGFVLVIFSGYFFIKLRFIFATIAGWLLVLLFNIVMFNYSDASYFSIMAYNFFYIAANIICMFAAYYTELFYRRNYWLTEDLNQKAIQLHDQNVRLDELVKIRTSELEENQKKLSILFESMSDMVVMHELVFNDKNEPVNYIITDCNTAFTEIFGIKKESALNKTADIVYNVSAPPYLNEFSRVAITGESIRFETYFDPIEKHFLVSVVAIGINKFATITMDITERKKSVQELVEKNLELERQYEDYYQLNEVLRQTNYNLELALDKASESDRLKTAFLQNISHEIRTPLNGILGFSKMISVYELTKDERAEYASVLDDSCKRLLNTVNDILDISRIDTQQVVIQKRACSPLEIVYSLIGVYQTNLYSKGIDVLANIDPASEHLNIISDDKSIYQILNALLSNSEKFTKTGKIEIGFFSNVDEMTFFVKDTGIGIRASEINKIFDRFYQADQSISRGFEGTGLGLSIAKGLAVLLDGKIWVESEEGVGTTFYFNLPINNELNN